MHRQLHGLSVRDEIQRRLEGRRGIMGHRPIGGEITIGDGAVQRRADGRYIERFRVVFRMNHA